MNRPSFALTVLLAAIAGPLCLAGSARSETTNAAEVCTPAPSRVHPADLFGLLPYPPYDDNALANADGDWRDFVDAGHATTAGQPVSNNYDDLFDTLREVAANTFKSFRPSIIEADAEAYKGNSANAASYQPYAEEAAEPAAEPAAAATVNSGDEYSSLEAYEAEFSGYGTTDYVRDNYGYYPVPVEGSARGNALTAATVAAWDSALVQDSLALASDAITTAYQLANEIRVAELIETSELAWDRIEEQNRLAAPTIALDDSGFRLADDDCGWDCDYALRGGLNPPAAEKVAAPATFDRQTLVSVARSLRSLAIQLEEASNWVAQLGGIDVAELEAGSAAR
ncbi:MAG TPA: hypothetical protein VL096_07190 [Pirellulaceae bacterium]|nr:hypothetical protein [Pirellulaceae bacterium]